MKRSCLSPTEDFSCIANKYFKTNFMPRINMADSWDPVNCQTLVYYNKKVFGPDMELNKPWI